MVDTFTVEVRRAPGAQMIITAAPVPCSYPGHRAEHDTMDPAHLQSMANQLPGGRYHHCPNGSHLAHVDDQQTYFEGLVRFLQDVDQHS